MKFDLARMEQQLILHEGLKLKAYQDTEENWTVFVGYNLEARGVEQLEDLLHRSFPSDFAQVSGTEAEAMIVLAADITRFDAAIPHVWPYYNDLDGIRQRVALDMAFNMGFHALGFKNCIAAIERRDYSTAVKELYKSKWARQVGTGLQQRCGRLARMLLTGLDYTE